MTKYPTNHSPGTLSKSRFAVCPLALSLPATQAHAQVTGGDLLHVFTNGADGSNPLTPNRSPKAAPQRLYPKGYTSVETAFRPRPIHLSKSTLAAPHNLRGLVWSGLTFAAQAANPGQAPFMQWIQSLRSKYLLRDDS